MASMSALGVTTRPGAGEAAVWRRRLAGAEAEIALLRRQVALDGDRVATLEADNARLTVEVERLEASRRAGKRQAAPFSRDAKTPNPRRPGRKAGDGYGTKARRERPAPERIDESVAVGLPACCPACDGQVVFDEVREQFQEELVPARSRIRRYEVALGHCADCKRRVRGRHPDQTSDALGAAGVMLGPRAHALAAWLHVGLGVPMAKVAKILQTLGGIAVTPGGLHAALHRTACDAESTYAALLRRCAGPVRSRRTRRAGASMGTVIGCGPTSATKSRCMTSPPAAATATPRPSWAKTSPACSSATGGRRTAGSNTRRIKRVWRTCCAAARS